MNLSGKILIICTTFNFPDELQKTLPCIMNVLNHRTDTNAVILDNLSKDPKVHNILDAAKHNQLTIIKNEINHGRALSMNKYVKDNLSLINCPRIIIFMDPDLIFDTKSFDEIIEALDTIPKLGMLTMRYENNEHNPERSLWLPPKKIKIKDKVFKIRCPIFANVPGGFVAMHGYVFSHYLNWQLFPKTKNKEYLKKGYIMRGENGDAYIYNHLKKYGLIQGYLEGTQITHLKSPPQTKNYIQ